MRDHASLPRKRMRQNCGGVGGTQYLFLGSFLVEKCEVSKEILYVTKTCSTIPPKDIRFSTFGEVEH